MEASWQIESEKEGEAEFHKTYLQVVNRRFMLGVHQPVSGLTIPIEHLLDLLECFSEFLGQSACAALLFHLGRKVGRTYCEKHQNRENFDEKISEADLAYLPMLKEASFDRENRRGTIVLKIFNSNNPSALNLLAFYLKGFIKGFIESVVGSEPKVIREKYSNSAQTLRLELTFSF
ncbi:MAG: hypothetical protein ACXQTV_02780 [Candidatus Hecatellaceae archaeon]